MAEPMIVLRFTADQVQLLDAMATEGYRTLRDDAAPEPRAEALKIVHTIDRIRRDLADGKPVPEAEPTPVSDPDELIEQAAKVLGKFDADKPWPSFTSKWIIEKQHILARRLAAAGLLVDPKLKADHG